MRFDGQTVVVTGAGGGLGKAYALFFGSRGANVVVNDLGGSFKGEGRSSETADAVVHAIRAAKGKAVANYDSVEDGEKIIGTAIEAFGRIDILLNNAGILRDISFGKMADADWDLIINVHVRGAYKCARAAWPYFRKQNYGRIINTTSAAGLFGAFGQCNYSAAKLSQVGFTATLAREGSRHNIICNAIAPIAASRMTETVMPPDILDHLRPEWVVPLVAVLTHPSNTEETGSVFEVGGGHIAKLRWERSKGALLKIGQGLTPGAVLSRWADVNDFSEPSHPTGVADFMSLHEEAQKLTENVPREMLDFGGKVALITGAGGGLGRSYALLFARHGACVVVNDLMNPDDVVREIQSSGGQAIGNRDSVLDGDAVVKAAIDAYGRLDIIVNNAGILKDKSFNNMDDDMWDEVIAVHLRGTYKITKAAWQIMLKQKYGRIVNTTSTSGMYGNFGQANYATAKLGILGLSLALAREGAKYNVYVNTIAPNAGTNMTRSAMPEELVQAFKPEQVAPMVLALCSDTCPDPTGGLYEVGSGWHARTRWQRSGGHGFPIDIDLTPEAVLKVWEKITTFEDGRADNPESGQDGLRSMMSNMRNRSTANEANDQSNEGIIEKIEQAKMLRSNGSYYTYDDKDVILYNLAIGAKSHELRFTYEGSEDFEALPTFGVIPSLGAELPWSMDDILPRYSPMMLLHGEQYLEIRKFPIPTSANLISYPKLIEVIDKGKSAIVISGITTREARTGEDVFYNESSLFLRGSGGFGGPAKDADRGAATAIHPVPQRQPDVVIEECTTTEQAALYRMSGDRNPLHIDPDFAKVAGFDVPILHGLCFFGISGKHVYQTFGPIKSFKARFAGTVTPGQALRTQMWKEGQKVMFQTSVIASGRLCIAGACAELMNGHSEAKL